MTTRIGNREDRFSLLAFLYVAHLPSSLLLHTEQMTWLTAPLPIYAASLCAAWNPAAVVSHLAAPAVTHHPR